MHQCITVIKAKSFGKHDAVNRDMPDASTFDVLLVASDDMIPICQGYDDIIRDSMQQFFPDTDGVLFFNDGYAGRRLNTLVIMGAAYYKRFNYIYNTVYKSLFADNEFMRTADLLGKQVYFDKVIIKHEHPANTATEITDDLYKHNDEAYYADQKIWRERRKFLYDLTIMICTLPARQTMLHALIDDINVFKTRTSVRVQVIWDARENVSTGKKRTDLLLLAEGKYSAFIDDDDKITPAYFTVIEQALATKQDYDCIQLHGRKYTNMLFDHTFHHSVKYSKWETLPDGKRVRMPNHLNPIKTDIARQVKYADISHGEDHAYSIQLQKSGLLQTEYAHDQVQYLYYYTPKVVVKPETFVAQAPSTVKKLEQAPIRGLPTNYTLRKNKLMSSKRIGMGMMLISPNNK